MQTSAFTEALTITDDHLIKCIWLSSWHLAAKRTCSVFHRTANELCTLQPEYYMDRSERLSSSAVQKQEIPLNFPEPSVCLFSVTVSLNHRLLSLLLWKLLKNITNAFSIHPWEFNLSLQFFIFSYFDSIESFISLRTLIALPMWW